MDSSAKTSEWQFGVICHSEEECNDDESIKHRLDSSLRSEWQILKKRND